MFDLKLCLFFAICLSIVSCGVTGAQQRIEAPAPARVPTYAYEIVRSFPHDPAAFTQGLLYHNGFFYESTGLNGQSSLRRVEVESGQVLQSIRVDGQYFAEGLALWQGRLLQLTWQNQRGFIYDLNSFNLIRTFNYSGEGWGLTNDDNRIIMSDGTNRIRFLNPDTLEVLQTIDVYDRDRAIDRLNELEYINGEIWANIWLTDRIARIDPRTGRVTAWVNLAGLLSPADRGGRSVDVLNGIAYDKTTDRLFVTGKWWPRLYEIRVKLPRNTLSR